MSSLLIARITIGPPDNWHEAVGDPITNLGGAPVPQPRSALRHAVTLSTFAGDGLTDTLQARLTLRRQLRAMLNNTPLKLQGFLYLQYIDDPEQNGWYVPDQGNLTDGDGSSGLATGWWKLDSVVWMLAGHSHTNREARNIWMKDLRAGIAYRDTLKLIYSASFAGLPGLQLSVLPNGAASAINTVTSAVQTTITLPTCRDGGVPQQIAGEADLACISYERPDASRNLSDVIVYDRGGALGPFGVGTYDSPAGIVDPQGAYGWNEVPGPDWPWSWTTPWTATPGGALSIPIAHDPADSLVIGTASVLVIPANAARQRLEIFNQDPAAIVNGALGVPATLNQGFVINPNGEKWATPEDTGGVTYTGAVYLISNLANTTVSWVEV